MYRIVIAFKLNTLRNQYHAKYWEELISESICGLKALDHWRKFGTLVYSRHFASFCYATYPYEIRNDFIGAGRWSLKYCQWAFLRGRSVRESTQTIALQIDFCNILLPFDRHKDRWLFINNQHIPNFDTMIKLKKAEAYNMYFRISNPESHICIYPHLK